MIPFSCRATAEILHAIVVLRRFGTKVPPVPSGHASAPPEDSRDSEVRRLSRLWLRRHAVDASDLHLLGARGGDHESPSERQSQVIPTPMLSETPRRPSQHMGLLACKVVSQMLLHEGDLGAIDVPWWPSAWRLYIAAFGTAPPTATRPSADAKPALSPQATAYVSDRQACSLCHERNGAISALASSITRAVTTTVARGVPAEVTEAVLERLALDVCCVHLEQPELAGRTATNATASSVGAIPAGLADKDHCAAACVEVVCALMSLGRVSALLRVLRVWLRDITSAPQCPLEPHRFQSRRASRRGARFADSTCADARSRRRISLLLQTLLRVGTDRGTRMEILSRGGKVLQAAARFTAAPTAEEVPFDAFGRFVLGLIPAPSRAAAGASPEGQQEMAVLGEWMIDQLTVGATSAAHLRSSSPTLSVADVVSERLLQNPSVPEGVRRGWVMYAARHCPSCILSLGLLRQLDETELLAVLPHMVRCCKSQQLFDAYRGATSSTPHESPATEWLVATVDRIVASTEATAVYSGGSSPEPGQRILRLTAVLVILESLSGVGVIRAEAAVVVPSWRMRLLRRREWKGWLRRLGSPQVLRDVALAFRWIVVCESSESFEVAEEGVRRTCAAVEQPDPEDVGLAVLKSYLSVSGAAELVRVVGGAIQTRVSQACCAGSPCTPKSTFSEVVTAIGYTSGLMLQLKGLPLRCVRHAAQTLSGVTRRGADKCSDWDDHATALVVLASCVSDEAGVFRTLRAVLNACGDLNGVAVVNEVLSALLADPAQAPIVAAECSADANMFSVAALCAAANHQWHRGLELLSHIRRPSVHHVELMFRLLQPHTHAEHGPAGAGQALLMDLDLLWRDHSTTTLHSELIWPDPPTEIAPERWREALAVLAVGLNASRGTEREQHVLRQRASAILRCTTSVVGIREQVMQMQATVSRSVPAMVVAKGWHATHEHTEHRGKEQVPRLHGSLYDLKRAAATRNWELAFSLVRRLAHDAAPRHPPAKGTEQTLQSVVRVMASLGRWRESAAVLQWMTSGRLGFPGNSVSHHCYLHVLRAARGGSHWQLSLAVLERMRLHRVPMTFAHTAESLACFAAKEAPLEAIHLLLHSTRASPQAAAPNSSSLLLGYSSAPPAPVTRGGDNSSRVAPTCSGSLPHALELSLVLMEARREATASSAPVWHAALRLAARHCSHQQDVAPGSPPLSPRSFTSLSSILCREGRWTEAMRILDIQRQCCAPIREGEIRRLLSSALPRSEWRAAVTVYGASSEEAQRSPLVVHELVRLTAGANWEVGFRVVAQQRIRTFTSMQLLCSSPGAPMEARSRAWLLMRPRFPISLRHAYAPALLQYIDELADHIEATPPATAALSLAEWPLEPLGVLLESFGQIRYRRIPRSPRRTSALSNTHKHYYATRDRLENARWRGDAPCTVEAK